jgi:hypothetical protein
MHKVPSHLNIMRSIPVPEHVIHIGAAAATTRAEVGNVGASVLARRGAERAEEAAVLGRSGGVADDDGEAQRGAVDAARAHARAQPTSGTGARPRACAPARTASQPTTPRTRTRLAADPRTPCPDLRVTSKTNHIRVSCMNKTINVTKRTAPVLCTYHGRTGR